MTTVQDNQKFTPASTDSSINKDLDSTVDRVVQGAHETVDRLADAATPAIGKLQDHLNASVDALGDSAGLVEQLGEDGVASLRALVREHPLAALASAAAVGLLIARLSR